ncbi:MAG: hypothetical protein IK095_02195 [Oscillospiraceae bacterium]|nr:hypothetical protein [Oscillospiraceae bacterium]
MAKKVKIPGNVTRLEIVINGVSYVYKGGQTVSVPDEVADLLENNSLNAPSGTRVTGEVKNGGLVPEGFEEQVPVYTDAQGNLLVAQNTNEARVVRFTDVSGTINADTAGVAILTMAARGKAVLGVLDMQVLPLISASGQMCVFQGSVVDGTEGTLTVRTITMSRTSNTLTEKVYDLTEHSEDAAEQET